MQNRFSSPRPNVRFSLDEIGRVCLTGIATILLSLVTVFPDTAFALEQPNGRENVAPLAQGNCSYVVLPGDTLYSLAARFRVSVSYLASLNGIYNPNYIYVGLVLRVPCASPVPIYPPPVNICSYHVVQPGEWLILIAVRYNVSWYTLAAINNLYNPNFIVPGTRLAIPCGATIPPTPTPPKPESSIGVPWTDPATGRTKLVISAQDLQTLAPVLQREGLTTDSVNTSATVALALPPTLANVTQNNVLILSAPLKTPPSADWSSTLTISLGILQTGRSLNFSTGARMDAGVYLVQTQGGKLVFIDKDGKSNQPGLSVDVRTLKPSIQTPFNILTYKDTCETWNGVQVCHEPGLKNILTTAELSRLTTEMSQAADRLVRAGVITKDDLDQSGGINAQATMPDVEGSNAVNEKQASMIIAPTINHPKPAYQTKPDLGTLIGAINVYSEINVNTGPVVAPGSYAVRVLERQSAQQNLEFVARLRATDGKAFDLPLSQVSARGIPSIAPAPEEPLAIVLGWALSYGGYYFCAPWWESCPH